MQADQINLIALKVQRKYYTEPRRDTQRWQSRHDQLLQGAQGLPKQELPATMLSMDFKRIWITDRSADVTRALSCCEGAAFFSTFWKHCPKKKL